MKLLVIWIHLLPNCLHCYIKLKTSNSLHMFVVELGIEARIVLVLTRASLRLSCRTAAHGARVIKQNRRGSFRSVNMAGLAV